ncbi:MAG: hypothetical protein U0768_08875 [Anaerolineae bacterium]
MPGPPVTIGCVVIITPGATGPPDTGTIVGIFPPVITANGMPLAMTGSLCTMVNSLTGVPYPLVIGPLASSGVTVGGRGLVRMGDNIPTPPGILTIVGPPATLNVIDQSPP